MDTLWGIGVRTVGDVLALPRDGFARRFGASLLDQIDRARGSSARCASRCSWRRSVITVSSSCHHRWKRRRRLLFAVRRLVVELAGFLHGRGAGVTRMRFDLVHEDVPPTSIVIGLAATRQIEHMQNVLRERLSRLQLPDRVEAIRLVSEETAPLARKGGRVVPGIGQGRRSRNATDRAPACAAGRETRCMRWRSTPIIGPSARRGARKRVSLRRRRQRSTKLVSCASAVAVCRAASLGRRARVGGAEVAVRTRAHRIRMVGRR